MAEFMMAMLVCRDLEKSKIFYRDTIGLKLISDASPHWIDFDLGGGRRLGLHPAGEHLPIIPGSLQLTFAVANTDSLVSDARTAGVRIFQDPFNDKFGRVAVLADPDGYPVQVMSPVQGSR